MPWSPYRQRQRTECITCPVSVFFRSEVLNEILISASRGIRNVEHTSHVVLFQFRLLESSVLEAARLGLELFFRKALTETGESSRQQFANSVTSQSSRTTNSITPKKFFHSSIIFEAQFYKKNMLHKFIWKPTALN